MTFPDYHDTIPLAALRGHPGYAQLAPAQPSGYPIPYYAAPPAPLTVVSVTVGDSASGPDGGRVHAALTYIRLKTAILEAAGHADRIDQSERARLRGDPVGPRSTVGEIRREAAFLLRGTAGAR